MLFDLCSICWSLTVYNTSQVRNLRPGLCFSPQGRVWFGSTGLNGRGRVSSTALLSTWPLRVRKFGLKRASTPFKQRAWCVSSFCFQTASVSQPRFNSIIGTHGGNVLELYKKWGFLPVAGPFLASGSMHIPSYTRHIASVEDRYVRYSIGHEERPGQ